MYTDHVTIRVHIKLTNDWPMEEKCIEWSNNKALWSSHIIIKQDTNSDIMIFLQIHKL